MKRHLVVMAAGTGGHVMPGLAVAAEMQKANAPFEMMLYPGQTHRVGGTGVSEHLWGTILSFLDRHVKNKPAAQPRSAE